MRLIDADALMEHVYRDRLDSRELIAEMVRNAPTIEPKRRLPKSSGYQPEDDKPEWTGGTINSDGRIAQ